MPVRRLPVRPDLDQLRHLAKDLLRAIRSADPVALADLREFHPSPPAPAAARLSDAQLVLARSHGSPSWPRLVQACQLTDAIWRDDLAAVRLLIDRNPQLLGEDALVRKSNWGPPLTYAANLGRDRIIEALYAMGARDLASARERAVLQSQIGTAWLLHRLMGSPRPPADALAGPAYTLSDVGTEFLLGLGVPLVDAEGRRLAPVDVVLESDSRKPTAKHRILELYVRHGLELPDTPVMAVHRGRIDLLEEHLRRDPHLLRRTFAHQEIYPPDLGCHDEVLATHGTPLAGATLLHMCVDYDELEIARWLLDRGMNIDARAEVDAAGFGGHTALFSAVVSQVNFWTNRNGEQAAPFADLLLERGADPNARASLRKQLHPGYGDDRIGVYHDVTPLGWGRRFHGRAFVSAAAMRRIEAQGGRE